MLLVVHYGKFLATFSSKENSMIVQSHDWDSFLWVFYPYLLVYCSVLCTLFHLNSAMPTYNRHNGKECKGTKDVDAVWLQCYVPLAPSAKSVDMFDFFSNSFFSTCPTFNSFSRRDKKNGWEERRESITMTRKNNGKDGENKFMFIWQEKC